MSALALVAVALGGALGAVARYLTDLWTVHRWGTGWPISTLSVNVVGSVILGALTGLSLRLPVSETVTLVLGVGFCGALTTFSGFMLQVWDLADPGRAAARKSVVSAPARQWSWRGPAYMGISLGAGLLAAQIPMEILR
ncbi:MAG: fluoride efflux transporter CrcB [Actinomycetota bacterium]